MKLGTTLQPCVIYSRWVVTIGNGILCDVWSSSRKQWLHSTLKPIVMLHTHTHAHTHTHTHMHTHKQTHTHTHKHTNTHTHTHTSKHTHTHVHNATPTTYRLGRGALWSCWSQSRSLLTWPATAAHLDHSQSPLQWSTERRLGGAVHSVGGWGGAWM